PIHESATVLAPAGDQRMTARLEGDHRKCCAKFAQLGHVLPIQPTGPAIATMAQPGPAGPAGLRVAALLPLDKHFERFPSLADQPVPHPTAETAAVGHEVQGLEHAGLARSVGPEDQVHALSRRKGSLGETPELPQMQPGDLHATRTNAKRPAIAGRPAGSTWNTVRTTVR